MRRNIGILAAVLCLGMMASACSSDNPPSVTGGDSSSDAASVDPTTSPSEPAKTATPSPSPTATKEPEPATPTLEVTIRGDRVTPNAQEISLERGQALAIVVISDRAGELHAHTKPDQYVEFDRGRTEATLKTDVPGVFEIEDHETEAVVAQVEARG